MGGRVSPQPVRRAHNHRLWKISRRTRDGRNNLGRIAEYGTQVYSLGSCWSLSFGGIVTTTRLQLCCEWPSHGFHGMAIPIFAMRVLRIQTAARMDTST